MSTNEKTNNQFKKVDSNVEYKFGHGPIRKPLPSIKKSFKPKGEKKSGGSKTYTVPAFRTTDDIGRDLEKRMEEYFKGEKINKSHFMELVLTNFLSNTDELLKENELANKVNSMVVQHSKLGNNLNQVAHSLNILKRKKSFSREDKKNIIKYYELIKIIKERYQVVTKKILNMKF